MDTFVADIANLILNEELNNVILVGHSFGTRPIIGVADQMPERIEHLVFLDGGFPFEGRSRLDGMPVAAREARIAAAQQFSGGISVPPPPAEQFGLSERDDIAWVNRRLTPHPLSVDGSPLSLTYELGNGLPCTYVRFTDPTFAQVEPSAEYARAQSGWDYLEISGGHDAIIANPEPISVLLHQIAMRASTASVDQAIAGSPSSLQ